MNISSHSNFDFGQHLQHLFDVVVALNRKDPLDLVRFQLFIHHRAFCKLGWRVQEFLTHWGVLPFDLLIQHPDPSLPSETFDFAFVGPHFHECIHRYLKPGPEMYIYSTTKQRQLYWVHSGNALLWLAGLKEVWSGLQGSLLVQHKSKWKVRDDSPSPQIIYDIVTRLFIFEALLPIFVHLFSTESAARALHNAGE